MALALISCIVLGPLTLLVVDLLRGPEKARRGASGPDRSGLRPTGGRGDHFGDGVLDRPA